MEENQEKYLPFIDALGYAKSEAVEFLAKIKPYKYDFDTADENGKYKANNHLNNLTTEG